MERSRDIRESEEWQARNHRPAGVNNTTNGNNGRGRGCGNGRGMGTGRGGGAANGE